MANNSEAYSQFGRRSDQPNSGDYRETEDSYDNESVLINAIHRRRVTNPRRRDVVRRRRNTIRQRRDAYIRQFRYANQFNSEGNLIGIRSQDRFNSALNSDDYVDLMILANLAEDDGVEQKATPTAKSVVDTLKVKMVECEKDVHFCVICQDSVNVGEIAKELPCVHNYHADCIQSWLATRNTCPVCRFELPTSDPVNEREEE